MNNTITDAANDFLLKHLESGSSIVDDNNPFYNSDTDGELYLKYDSIRIKNITIIHDSMKPNTHNIEIGYYWQDIKVCVFIVDNVSLNNTNGSAACLDLNGIGGSIKMVLL